MSHSVSQKVPAGEHHFSVAYLHEFVASANKLGLPDQTEVSCLTRKDGSVFLLFTHSHQEWEEDATTSVTTTLEAEPAEAATTRVAERTGVAQSPTGPVETWRRWFKTHVARRLTLGDVRQLLARLNALSVPTEEYAVFGLRIPRGGDKRGLVHNISAEPKPEQANA